MQHCTYTFKVPSKGGARSSWGGPVAGAGTAVAIRGPGEGALRQQHSGGLSPGHSTLMANRGWVTLALPTSLPRALGQPRLLP